ncbi:zinc finger, CCHC-type containing protein [Tanacetum coccineum]
MDVDEALDKFKVFKNEVELQQGSLIKRFRTDRGGERGIECIFVGYANHSKAFRFFVIEPNESISINSIIESKDDIFDENRFSSSLVQVSVFLNELKTLVVQWMLPSGKKQLMMRWIPSWASTLSKFDESGKGVIIYLYVDDMLIFGTDQDQVDLKKEFLLSRFSMKDMGEADVILGIRITHESNRITIFQSYYIEKVLKKFNYFDCTPMSTPMDTSKKLIPNNGQAVSQLEYFRVIGCLMYAMTYTQPDIAFAVGKLRRLTYTGYPSVLEGYTAASWISNSEDNSSTSGWVFLLGGGVISWASKKQTCITGSTMESEFVALVVGGKEVECVATLAKAYSQMYNGKSRHLSVRHNMIREIITNMVISIKFVSELVLSVRLAVPAIVVIERPWDRYSVIYVNARNVPVNLSVAFSFTCNGQYYISQMRVPYSQKPVMPFVLIFCPEALILN